MRDTFNLGVGLILIANQNTVDGLLHHCEEVGERATIIGKVVTE
jgi:phosphoribosylaminoimidazole (AIR) synthetase